MRGGVWATACGLAAAGLPGRVREPPNEGIHAVMRGETRRVLVAAQCNIPYKRAALRRLARRPTATKRFRALTATDDAG